MDDQTDHLDQADEDILTYTVSDEAVEGAAGVVRGLATPIQVLVSTVPFAAKLSKPSGWCGPAAMWISEAFVMSKRKGLLLDGLMRYARRRCRHHQPL
jgi:hypothetical protein